MDINMYTVFDVETTGLLIPSYPINSPKQGRIIQLGALLLDEQFNEVNTFCSLIKLPDHVEMNEKAFQAHGITKEKAQKYGIPIELAIVVLDSFLNVSDYHIGHSIDFDIGMIQQEDAITFGKPRLIFKNTFCTMKLTTNICKLPFRDSRKGGYKWPKLEEAFLHVTGLDYVDGHDSLTDCRATATIFKWLKDNNHIPQLSEPIIA